MSLGARDRAMAAAVSGAACIACCMGPIAAFLAAIGISTAAGFVFFGASSLILGAAAAALLIRYKPASPASHAPPESVAVELSMTRPRR